MPGFNRTIPNTNTASYDTFVTGPISHTFGCPVNRTFERANPTLLKNIIYVVSVLHGVYVMTKQHPEYKILRQLFLGAWLLKYFAAKFCIHGVVWSLLRLYESLKPHTSFLGAELDLRVQMYD